MDFFGLSFEPRLEEVILRLEKEGENARFWNVPRSSAVFLHSLVETLGARNVLEIGTSNGYSGLFLSHAAAKNGGKLYTVESHNERFSLAQQHFAEAGVDSSIVQIKGHAPEVLDEIDEAVRFDFVFIDATKMEYEQYVPAILPRLNKEALLVADNILSHWDDLEGFVEKIRADENFESYLLDMDSGLLIFSTSL